STMTTDHDDLVDKLLSQMTTEEKAGQLTQFFYFSGIDPQAAGEVGQAERVEQPALVERALAAGQVGSLLFVRKASEANRLQRLTIEGNRLSIPALFGFDVIHGLRTIMPVPIAMAASWTPTSSSGRKASLHEKRVPSASTGPSRPCATSPATRDGVASSKAPERTRCSARQSPPRRCAASRVAQRSP